MQKKVQPTSNNEVLLNLDESQINLRPEQRQKRTNSDSLNLNYTTDLNDKNRETLLYKDVNRLQLENKSYSKTLDKKINYYYNRLKKFKDTSI